MRQYLKIVKWNSKWQKLQKSLKQWQGAWRNHNTFDKYCKLPLKLSNHTFVNGSRCAMKLRSSKSRFLTSSKFPKSSLRISEDTNYFASISRISIEEAYRYDFASINRTKEEYLLWSNDFSFSESSNIDKEIESTLYKGLSNMKDTVMAPVDCEIYTALCAKKGKILLYFSESKKEYYVVFIILKVKNECEDQRQMFNFKYTPGTKLVKRWKLKHIREIYKRHIVDQKSALELTIIDKSILFNFQTKEIRDAFCNKLFKIQEKLGCPIKTSKHLKQSVIDDWVNWRISTYDYLMLLNNYSGRSFNNCSQYPIFPWIIDSCTPTLNLSNSHVYRDLSKNMGMLGDKERAESFKNRYANTPTSVLGRFHFGSHYSSPGVTFQYMMRIFPFVEAYIRLFDGLDNPNRMFHSVSESLEISKRDPSDVKELIPEFFCLPEMFQNGEGFFFGVREEDKQEVNDVALPPWSGSSPFKFVSIMKQALESDWVAGTINAWIDLVFGFKQRGKEAEKACNVYSSLSQNPNKVIARSNDEQKEAFILQAYHWGQTPIQIITKAHPERVLKNSKVVYSIIDPNSCPDVYTLETKIGKIIRIFVFENTNKEFSVILIGINGNILKSNVNFLPSRESKEDLIPSFSNIQEKQYNNHYLDHVVSQLDSFIEFDFPIVLLRNRGAAYLVQGGYIDGTIQFTQLDTPEKTSKLKVHKDSVRCLEVDSNERFALSGSSSGELAILEINESMKWEIKRYIHDHDGAISHIYISKGMNLFCSSGLDGVVNLYSYSGQLLRTLREPYNLPIRYTMLSESPLPCLVTYTKETGTLRSFGLSGELLHERNDVGEDILAMGIGRNSNFCDHLITSEQKQGLVSRKLPTLDKGALDVSKAGTTLALFENQKMIVIGGRNGEVSLIWDPRSSIKKQNIFISILQ